MSNDEDLSQLLDTSYAIGYAPDAGVFNFNVMAFFSILFFALTAASAYAPLLVPGFAAACVAYYSYPLKERRPRIGAGQYGIFIDGLGLVSWRAVESLEVVPFTSRLARTYELQIELNCPLERALLVNWKRLPVWRMLMKLPWYMKKGRLIRIPLEPFEAPQKTIYAEFVRLREQYG